ncbi:MAG: universal stress protein [Rhizobacter sp.]|nr:universal stress protein [Rhizobacter sp.]
MRALLVHLDASPACAVRLHLARQLAEQHHASVTAMFAVVPGSSGLPTSFSAAAIAQAVQTIDIDGRHRARAALEKTISMGGPPVAWAESAAEAPARALARHGLFADLLVLGKRDPSGPHADQLPADFAESVVIESGKAALVVPDDARADPIGRVIVIAWKPSRESARAVTAALPLLRRAQAVHVLMWQDKSDTATPGQHLGWLSSFLHTHGVSARTHALGNAPSRIGEAMLAQTQQLGGDLLVMGCYGHSRARELVLGGASRSVLNSMRLPVLMAH